MVPKIVKKEVQNVLYMGTILAFAESVDDGLKNSVIVTFAMFFVIEMFQTVANGQNFTPFKDLMMEAMVHLAIALIFPRLVEIMDYVDFEKSGSTFSSFLRIPESVTGGKRPPDPRVVEAVQLLLTNMTSFSYLQLLMDATIALMSMIALL